MGSCGSRMRLCISVVYGYVFSAGTNLMYGHAIDTVLGVRERVNSLWRVYISVFVVT